MRCVMLVECLGVGVSITDIDYAYDNSCGLDAERMYFSSLSCSLKQYFWGISVDVAEVGVLLVGQVLERQLGSFSFISGDGISLPVLVAQNKVESGRCEDTDDITIHR